MEVGVGVSVEAQAERRLVIHEPVWKGVRLLLCAIRSVAVTAGKRCQRR